MNKKYLGIDYGKKNVGIAISDENATFAFPYQVLLNDVRLIENIEKICLKEKIVKIIVGRSVNYKMEENPIMEKIYEFTGHLMEAIDGIEIGFADETLTSREAAHIVGDDDNLDARAAALILRTYLESGDIHKNH